MATTGTAKRLAILIALLIFSSAGVAAYLAHARPAADAAVPLELIHLLPSDANGFAYLDLAALRNAPDSPLGSVLSSKNLQRQSTDHDYQNFVRDTGFNFQRDLDRLAIALWPMPGAKGAPNPQFSGRMFAIADGHFDEKKIAAYALRTGKIIGSGTPAIYEIPGNPPTAFKFVSADRLEFASGEGSLKLLTGPAASPSSFDDITSAGLSRVSAAPLFLVFRNRDLSLDFAANQQQSRQIAQLLRSLQTISIAGVPDDKNVDIVIDGQSDSLSNALQIATLLEFSRSGAAMFLSNSKQSSPANQKQIAFLGALLQQVQVTHDDRWVRLRLDLTPAMLAQAQSLPGKVAPSRPQ